MAFPVPQHLPRLGNGGSLDSSTSQPTLAQRILSELSQSPATLTPELARRCVAQLDKAIRDTKTQISRSVERDFPAIEQQQQTARHTCQELDSLEVDVQKLQAILNDRESGILPGLLKNLSGYSVISQSSLDAELKSNILQYVVHCRAGLSAIESDVVSGQLTDAASKCLSLSALLDAPEHASVKSARAWNSLKDQFRTIDDNIQEQLSYAYRRAVTSTTSGPVTTFTIKQRVSQPGRFVALDLASIVSAMRDTTVASLSASLRKDIMGTIIQPLLEGRASLRSSDDSIVLDFNSKPYASPASGVSQVLTFLVSALPRPILASLRLNMSAALLERLLAPSLPSSLSGLPTFLRLVREAIDVEEQLGEETTVRQWADTVGLHYEKARRRAILEAARTTILADMKGELKVEEEGEPTPAIAREPVPPAIPPSPALAEDPSLEEEEASWDFDDEAPSIAQTGAPESSSTTQRGHRKNASVDDDNWGFDEELPDQSSTTAADVPPNWGWEDEGKSGAVVEQEDDPWDDSAPQKSAKSNGSAQPRPARRLERLSATRSKGTARTVAPPSAAPVAPSARVRGAAVTRGTVQEQLPKQKIKEMYSITHKAQAVLQLVNTCLAEARDTIAYKGLPMLDPPTGALLMATPIAIFDFFRAVPPPGASLRYVTFSNDCKYLSKAARKLASTIEEKEGRARWTETAGKLMSLSNRVMVSAVQDQIKAVNATLDSAGGFVNTSNEGRFSECNNAVQKTMQRCASVGREWKSILLFETYARALGAVIDSALSRIMEDILALPDITEAESHRLNTLCTMLHPVDTFFVRTNDAESEIALYVPSWFKFNYLSTLLEASLAHISEFFREGLLVDFEVQELVSLIRALFADTPLRAKTIDMVLAGHPAGTRKT